MSSTDRSQRQVASVAVLWLACAASHASAEEVTFRHEAPGAQAVFVAGEFNSWSPNATAMTDGDGDGIFEVTLPLDEGRYEYKFVVDGTWTTDETAAAFVGDPYGGRNSVLVVGDAPAAEVAAPAGAATPAAATAPVGDPLPVEFRYEPVISGDRAIFLAGTFNEWSTSATRMTDADGDGIYTVTVNLPPGRHAYKLVVEGQWMVDENAAEFTDDGHGGRNSIVIVGAEGATDGGSAAGGLYEVTLEHVAPTAAAVMLAGEFNEWSTTGTRMTDEDGDGTHEISLVLPAGRYAYKFVVNGTWTTDETASEFVDDGFGGRNSILIVDDRFEPVVLERGDGRIFDADLSQPQTIATANLVSEGELLLRARAYRNDVESVSVAVQVGDEWLEQEMHRFSEDAAFDHYETTVRPGGAVDVLSYVYVYRDGDAETRMGPAGLGQEVAPFVFDASTAARLSAPDWVRDGVIYQIFPERFANGDKKNDPKFEEWYYEGKTRLPRVGKFNGEYYHFVKNWYDVGGLSKSPYRSDGKPDYFSFYGGDIEGVRQNLDYLQDLGVTIIYFNPLTQGKSNYKYDATDYMTVDPHFGGNEAFASFVEAAHARGIRIIIDTVFNHTGSTHWAFQDGVRKGPDSEYWTWFEWKKWPLPSQGDYDAEAYYSCWWGFGDLPDLNFDLTRVKEQELAPRTMEEADPNMAVVEHLVDVARFWIDEMDIDGFRLDVPNEVPTWFWSHFIGEVRAMKEDVYVVAELWGDASDWIAKGISDATMNYRYFKDPVQSWIAKGQGTAESFDRALAPGRFVYPPQSQQVMMNLLDSHDTIRFLTQANGDARRLELAALFQMTYVGTPHVWYGDEIAMQGGADPDCRRPMYWKWSEEPERRALREHYKKLIALRKELRPLRRGTFRTLLAEGQTLAYAREDQDTSVLVVVNNGPREAVVSVPLASTRGIPPGTRLADELGTEVLEVTGDFLELRVAPVSGRVLSTRELRTEAR